VARALPVLRLTVENRWRILAVMSLAADGRPEPPRRSFMRTVTGILTGLLGAVATLPGLALLLHPARRETVSGGRSPLRVATLKELKPGVPVLAEVRGELLDAWNRIPDVKIGSCWLVRGQTDEKIRAFSTICPHLGCGIDFEASEPAGQGAQKRRKEPRFVCPCHDSHFSLDGKAIAGPAPRGMDELEVAIDGEEVKVAYRRFRVGTSTKEEV
jgi:menaquinol-cytochrome c reductase iron-sulfur subunit